MRWHQPLFLLLVIVSKSSGVSRTNALTEDGDRYKLLTFLLKFLHRVVEGSGTGKTETHPPTDGSLSVMTWNVLAPIWVNRAALKAGGVVDMNLLDNEIRLNLVIKNILEKSPDILHLQELQEDTFKTIRQSLSAVYSPVAFAPNLKDYWKSYLPEGMEYMKNGVATFYKRGQFTLHANNSFETSDQGSVALASVLRQILKSPTGEEQGEPLIVLNCHLESGITQQESALRLAQGTVVVNEAKRISDSISQSIPDSKPVIIIAGDINSANPFPGHTNFIQQGYLDAVMEVGNPAAPTFFYEQPIPLPSGISVSALTLDHVFVRKSDNDTGRIQLVSAEIPDIQSDEFSEKSYRLKVSKIMADKILSSNIGNFRKIIRGSAFNVWMATSSDNNNSDHNVNRVLRLGSDHLPVLVRFKLQGGNEKNLV